MDGSLAILALLLSGLLLAALSRLLATLAGLLVLLSGLLLPAATLLTALARLLILLASLTALVLSTLIGVVHFLPFLSIVTPQGVSSGETLRSLLRCFGFLIDRRLCQFRERFVSFLLFRQGLVEQLHRLLHFKLLRPGLERAVA